MLIVQLTQEQIEAIAPAYAKIGEMADAGKPGMLLAQVYRDHMRVGIMSHEAADKMYEALGTPADRRRGHRTAYDLMPEASNGPACNMARPWEEPA